MDILRQSQAPIPDVAWKFIHEEAGRHLKMHFSARRFVHVSGPHGQDYQVMPLGSVKYAKKTALSRVRHGIYQVRPLMEIRVPFKVDRSLLDEITRGNNEIDLDDLEEAARIFTQFEDQAVYQGFTEGQIIGLKDRSGAKPLTMPKIAEEMLVRAQEGINTLRDASVDGPYAFILTAPLFDMLSTYSQGYPIKPRLETLLGGPVIKAQHSDYCFLVPYRSDDIKLTLGMDASVGYDSADEKTVLLFLTESFTFYVSDPGSVIVYA